MLYFTILKQARRMSFCPVLPDGEFGSDGKEFYVYFFSTEAIVAGRDGKVYLFHVRELKDDKPLNGHAAISGYMVQGEDQLT